MMEYRDVKDLTQRTVQAQRLVLWEEVKGKLNAISALHGFGPENNLLYDERQRRYEELTVRIDFFVKEIEDNGLNE